MITKFIELDENNIVFNVGETTTTMQPTAKLLVGDFDISYLGKKYENGAFIDMLVTES